MVRYKIIPGKVLMKKWYFDFKKRDLSLNLPSGPIQSLSCHVCQLCVCVCHRMRTTTQKNSSRASSHIFFFTWTINKKKNPNPPLKKKRWSSGGIFFVWLCASNDTHRRITDKHGNLTTELAQKANSLISLFF